jgi:hypothetical protein
MGILPPSNGHQRVSYENWRHDDAGSGSSHHCPESARGPCDDQLCLLRYCKQFRWRSIPRLSFASDEARAETNYMSNQRESTITILIQRSIPFGRSKLLWYRATMAIDNLYDGKVVDGATNF